MVDCLGGFRTFGSPIVLQMKEGRCYHCVGSVDLETAILERESRVTNERWKKLPLCEDWWWSWKSRFSKRTGDVNSEPAIQSAICPRSDLDLCDLLSSDLAEQFPLLEVETVELASVDELGEVFVRHAKDDFAAGEAGELVDGCDEIEEDVAVVGLFDIEAVFGKCH
ncbi:hypothetical protein BOTCAL_0354g00060 [Botryotinia calthae]|uniref:Uncharacterized protein n=1 Tax=Botryotinia calthae TaxID=38488 RepID=A0A4Y8CSE9_9HELO|nr:hypothetical protein BOTCAL_0354g00060 [Botryotinia calthae]